MPETLSTGRQPRRTGVCLAVGSGEGRPGELDPRKEITVDERGLSAKVRRLRGMRLLCDEIVTGRQPRRTGVCLAVGSGEGRPGELDPRKEITVDERGLSAKVRRH